GSGAWRRRWRGQGARRFVVTDQLEAVRLAAPLPGHRGPAPRICSGHRFRRASVPPGDAVGELKERLDIVEVVSGYVRLKRQGRNYTGLCPFHAEKSPSFTVSGEKQVWYCFGCSEGGDLIRFVEKAEGLDFPQALELLAGRAGVELESFKSGSRRPRDRAGALAANRM